MSTALKERQENRPRRSLPEAALPRGLSRIQAAEYVGVGVTTFDRMVRDKLMPRPMRIYGRTVWDRKKIDAAMDELDKDETTEESWSRMGL